MSPLREEISEPLCSELLCALKHLESSILNPLVKRGSADVSVLPPSAHEEAWVQEAHVPPTGAGREALMGLVRWAEQVAGMAAAGGEWALCAMRGSLGFIPRGLM